MLVGDVRVRVPYGHGRADRAERRGMRRRGEQLSRPLVGEPVHSYGARAVGQRSRPLDRVEPVVAFVDE
jgi:hypothetical protein